MGPKRNTAGDDASNSKRVKVLSGMGIATNHRLLDRVLAKLNSMPSKEADEIIQSTRKMRRIDIEGFGAQCGCELELEIKPGKFAKLQCTSFAKLINMMVTTSPAFKEHLLQLWKAKPCTQMDPYSLLLYGDELVPGNVLHLDQSRKLFGCQGCIKDFGPEFTRSNASWMPLFCIRHTAAANIQGGMSYIFKTYLRQLFVVERISDRGIVVPVGTEAGDNIVLYFKLSNLICDGDALRMLMNWKGAKAKLPCFCCMNVLSQEEEDDLPDGCMSLNCRDKSRFVLSTEEDWWGRAMR